MKKFNSSSSLFGKFHKKQIQKNIMFLSGPMYSFGKPQYPTNEFTSEVLKISDLNLWVFNPEFSSALQNTDFCR